MTKTNTRKVRFGAVAATLTAALGGMVAVTSPASAASGGGCAATASVYGSYAIRACVGDIAGTASAYAYISLEAGHSPCTLKLRIADDRGYVSDAVPAACPAGAVTHFDPFPTYAVSTHPGKWTAYVSITRDGDPSPNAKSTSPPIIV